MKRARDIVFSVASSSPGCFFKTKIFIQILLEDKQNIDGVRQELLWLHSKEELKSWSMNRCPLVRNLIGILEAFNALRKPLVEIVN